MREGPELAALLRRVAETAPEFMAQPCVRGEGQVFTVAVVKDLFQRFGLLLPRATMDSLETLDRASQRLMLLLCWLLDAAEFKAQAVERSALLELLINGSGELASHASPEVWISDGERREELARVTLARLNLRPAGESVTQASDRLTSISSIERQRIMLATREAEARARALREALARKAAQEAADKWTRE